ncbi:glycerophosphodiester phosphodiesterase, partial [Pseudomonadota bacterium]
MNTQAIPDKVPTLIAHRGYALHYPENSLEAMEAALKAGALFVEFDVHLSADEEPMVIHDANVCT